MRTLKYIKYLRTGVLVFFVSFTACADGGKDYADNALFVDGISATEVTLFTLLNDYPALKDAFVGLDPVEFNQKLNASLSLRRDSVYQAMRGIEYMTLNPDSGLRPALLRASRVINRIRTQDEDAYRRATAFMERIRQAPSPFIPVVMPISHEGLNYLYNSHTEEELQQKMSDLAETLEDPETETTLKSIEDFLHKALIENGNSRDAIERIVSALGDQDLNRDRFLKSKLVGMIGGIGDMLGRKAGFSDFRSPDYAVKQLIVNLEEYNTASTGTDSGLNIYDTTSDYNQSLYNSELKTVLSDLYAGIRNLLTPPSSVVIDPSKTVLEDISVNLAELEFPASQSNVDSSLGKMLSVDLKGRNRASDSSSEAVSALESLLFTLVMADIYGYEWNNNPSFSSATPTISGSTQGTLTLGDAAYALRSKIRGDDTLSLIRFLYDSKNDGKVSRNNATYSFDINAPALMFLQGNSRGAMNPVDDQDDADSIYKKTLPWVLNWIKKIAYEGYGPYYAAGESPSANYQSSWNTDSFSIDVEKLNGSGSPVLPANEIGIGGFENSGETSYTIQEIAVTDRVADSKEEAFYKNFQWFLYEKRFVLIIPVHARLGASQIQHGVYITVIANGLMGLMDAKPYCELVCDKEDNGRWKKSGTYIKSDFRTTGVSSLNMSSVPGDSVVLVEAWGYGLDGKGSFAFGDDVLYGALYDSILFPQPPSVFRGLIPPAIAANAEVFGQLGFHGTTRVTAADVESNWDNRNGLLPFVAALAKALDDQTDSSAGKNAYTLLTDLARVAARPYLFRGTEPISGVSAIDQLKITGTGPSFGIRSPSMDDDLYYQDPALRSIISLLIEDERRYQDGLLNLVSKTDLLSDGVGMLAEFGRPERAAGREKLINGFLDLLDEVKVDADSPTPEQFNIETVFEELRDDIAGYPDSRSSDLDHSDWDGISDSVGFIYDFLANDSPYTLIGNIDALFDVIIDTRPADSEVRALLDIVAAILTEPDTSQSYLLTDIITQNGPGVVRSFIPNARGMTGALEGIASPNTFGPYFLDSVRSSYSIDAVLTDLERFLASPQIQGTGADPNNVLYATGTLMQAFADIAKNGKKPGGVGGYWFQDHWNITEESTSYFDRLNYVLSRKTPR